MYGAILLFPFIPAFILALALAWPYIDRLWSDNRAVKKLETRYALALPLISFSLLSLPFSLSLSLSSPTLPQWYADGFTVPPETTHLTGTRGLSLRTSHGSLHIWPFLLSEWWRKRTSWPSLATVSLYRNLLQASSRDALLFCDAASHTPLPPLVFISVHNVKCLPR